MGSTPYQVDTGMQAFEQATACLLVVPNASAEGHASAGFGPAIPQVGIARAAAQVSAFEAIGRADFSANVIYHFEIQPIDSGTIPAPAPALLPVNFSARGEGHAERSGYGLARSIGVAHLFGSPLGTLDAYFSFEAAVYDDVAYDPVDQEAQNAGFDETRSLNLYPNSVYNLVLSAACSLWVGPVGQNAPASAGCSTEVDPLIRFDQAAFDAAMGDKSFALDEHYRFVFSQNLPVPEPQTMFLLGAGLLGLGGWQRRRRATTATQKT